MLTEQEIQMQKKITRLQHMSEMSEMLKISKENSEKECKKARVKVVRNVIVYKMGEKEVREKLEACNEEIKKIGKVDLSWIDYNSPNFNDRLPDFSRDLLRKDALDLLQVEQDTYEAILYYIMSGKFTNELADNMLKECMEDL
jgi:hypothetical protein